MNVDLTGEQKRYLEGVARGLAAARASPQGQSAVPAGPERIHFAAQDRAVASGGKLSREEEAKRARHPLDIWDDIAANADRGEFPKALDVFRYKFHGLFYVAPAQDAFMCRLRTPNGITDACKLRAVAAIAEEFGGGYADVTTRANLQIREIGPSNAVDVLQRLADAGIVSRGAGADNVRNITGNPTAGIDREELFDTRSLGLALHHAILNHRELYGLPRKFNVAFDGGASVASLEDTNDVGFSAARLRENGEMRFRVAVGGITGHGDFARDLGVAIAADQCVPVAVAILRVFIDEGDRTDRKRARLKYVLDRLGLEAFLRAVESHLPAPLPKLAASDCVPRPALKRGAHMGFHDQKQPGRVYCGIALPAGRMTSGQMRGIADITERFGSGTVRLTVWQNIIVSDIKEVDRQSVERALQALGLTANASSIRAGLVACTGNAGCKFSASDTKRHALAIAAHLDSRLALDLPLNIHLTGCPHSCAQHAIGDIGLLATKIPQGEREVEGYHLFLGGGFGDQRGLGREALRDIPACEVPQVLERLLRAYLEQRSPATQTLHEFLKARTIDELRGLMRERVPEAV